MRRTPEEMAQSALETAKRKRARAVERVGRADAELRTSRKALLPPEQPVIGLRAVFDWAEHLRTELARLWEGTDATPVKPGEVVTVLRECEVLAAEVERLRREVDQCRTELGAVAYHAEHDPCDVCTHLEISDVIAERDDPAAKVARVEALAEKFEQWPSGPSYAVTAKAIRAALAGDGA